MTKETAAEIGAAVATVEADLANILARADLKNIANLSARWRRKLLIRVVSNLTAADRHLFSAMTVLEEMAE